MANINIKKSFKDISRQMERICILYYNGYGTERLFKYVENLCMTLFAKYGY